MDETLVGLHLHRGGFLTMARDYFRSGYGCADYLVAIPRCRFGRKRAAQIPAALLFEAMMLVGLFLQPLATALTGIVLLSALLGVTWHRQRTSASLLYPLLTAFLGTAFSFGFVYRFLRRGWRAPVRSLVKHVRRLDPASISSRFSSLRTEDQSLANQFNGHLETGHHVVSAAYQAHRLVPTDTRYWITCSDDVSFQPIGDRK